MSTLLAYLDRTIYGMTEFFRTDKSVVLLVAAFLYLWLKPKKAADNKENRMLVYSLIMTVVLLFPITAVAVVIYQTAFYDYAWAWSMVPVAAVVGYAAVQMYQEISRGNTRFQKVLPIVIILFVFFICGNQGTLQTDESTGDDGQIRAIAEALVHKEEAYAPVLWAPKNIMQDMRRQTGEILLIYGKDMWDEKAGAYDYEVYSEEFTGAYEWLELVELLASLATGEESFEMLQGEYELTEDAYRHTSVMIENGVNAIVVPKLASPMMGEALESIAAQSALTVEEIFTEQYTVYLLK